MLQNLPQKEKILMFYKLWISKESHLKRYWKGIADFLNLTSISPNFTSAFHCEGLIIKKSHISFLKNLPNNYIGAVAIPKNYNLVEINSD